MDTSGDKTQGIDDFWTHHTVLGVAHVRKHEQTVHLRAHVSEESYSDPPELFLLTQPFGTRTYVLAKPYPGAEKGPGRRP